MLWLRLSQLLEIVYSKLDELFSAKTLMAQVTLILKKDYELLNKKRDKKLRFLATSL